MPHPNNYPDDRKQRKHHTSLSSKLVRCVCITASLITTACGLLGLGVTCFVIQLNDPSAAPCPFHLIVTVFAVAAVLFSVSFVLLLFLCRKRNELRQGAFLTDLPPLKDKETIPGNEGVADGDKKDSEDAHISSSSQNNEVDTFAMTQKSADVSYWIEQQKAPEGTPEDCFPLEMADGATGQESDQESSEGEMTSL